MVGQYKGSPYPVLRMMARDSLAIPVSSVPCERAFSAVKHTDTDNRNRLLPEHLGAIQIAKADMVYWRNVRKEEKRKVAQEKLERWHEHELNTTPSTTQVLSM